MVHPTKLIQTHPPQPSGIPVVADEQYKKFTLQRISEIIPEPLILSWSSQEFMKVAVTSILTCMIPHIVLLADQSAK
jgi:hypothetical protein